MGEYAVTGAALSCTMGSADSKLMVIPHGVQVGGKDKANISDCAPFVNVTPFGMCKSMVNPAVASATAAAMGVLTQMPCTPVCAMWMGGKPDVLVQGLPALLKGDKTVCSLGAGMIEVEDSGQ